MLTERRSFPLVRVVHDVGGPLARRGSVAMMAAVRPPVTKAVVFVHGFGGRPLQSWSGFVRASEQEPSLASADLYFFGYDSLRRQLSSTSAKLSHLLELLLDGQLSALILSELGLSPEPNGYREIVLVGHSMGGVVVRDACRDLRRRAVGGREKIQLRLFAPAHLGSPVPGMLLAGAGAFPVLQPLVAFLAESVPASRDLGLRRPGFLQDLRRDTEDAVRNGDATLAADCAFGDQEGVVVVGIFEGDRRQVPDPSPHNHFTIVHPKADWDWPLRFALGGLR